MRPIEQVFQVPDEKSIETKVSQEWADRIFNSVSCPDISEAEEIFQEWVRNPLKYPGSVTQEAIFGITVMTLKWWKTIDTQRSLIFTGNSHPDSIRMAIRAHKPVAENSNGELTAEFRAIKSNGEPGPMAHLHLVAKDEATMRVYLNSNRALTNLNLSQKNEVEKRWDEVMESTKRKEKFMSELTSEIWLPE